MILKKYKPLLNGYVNYATMFAIIGETHMPWVYNHFVQIRHYNDWSFCSFIEHNDLLKTCPYLDTYKLPRTLIKKKWNGSVTDCIKEAIADGFYAYMYIDRYYTEYESTYHEEKYHLNHQVFVYGFDEKTNMIKYEDNLNYGKYISVEMKMEHFEKAYWTMDDSSYQYVSDVYLVKHREHSQFPEKFDVKELIVQLEDLIHSRPYIDLVREQECNFGLQCLYDLVIETRNDLLNKKTIIIRSYHFLYEYQMLMEMRLEYLIQENYLKENTDLIAQCQQIKREFFGVRNGILKYNFKLDINQYDDTVLKLPEKLQEAIELEEKFIHQLIVELREN